MVFQRPPTHLARQTLLGLELQVRFSAATSDGSGPLHTRSRRRTHKARRATPGRGHTRFADQRHSCTPPREPPPHLRASPLGRYIAGVLFSSGILTLGTCRPLWGEPCPCTLSALLKTLPFSSFSPIAEKLASHGEESLFVQSAHPKVSQLRVLFTGTRIQLSHLFVWD